MCYESYHLLKNSCRPIFISICRPSFVSICRPTFLNSCCAICSKNSCRVFTLPPSPAQGREVQDRVGKDMEGKALVGAIEVVQTSECSIILGLNVYIHYFSIYKCEMFRCAASLVGSVPLGVNCT